MQHPCTNIWNFRMDISIYCGATWKLFTLDAKPQRSDTGCSFESTPQFGINIRMYCNIPFRFTYNWSENYLTFVVSMKATWRYHNHNYIHNQSHVKVQRKIDKCPKSIKSTCFPAVHGSEPRPNWTIAEGNVWPLPPATEMKMCPFTYIYLSWNWTPTSQKEIRKGNKHMEEASQTPIALLSTAPTHWRNVNTNLNLLVHPKYISALT